MIEEKTWNVLIYNKKDKLIKSFFRKIDHFDQDVVHEGITYSYDSKTKKLTRQKKRYYSVKEPLWVKK